MPKSGIAKLFKNGHSQAVRLPQDFRFAGDRVRVRRVGKGVLLEPMTSDPVEWFSQLDQFGTEPFMEDGREQPITPTREIF
jgi:antitoxin VapB